MTQDTDEAINAATIQSMFNGKLVEERNMVANKLNLVEMCIERYREKLSPLEARQKELKDELDACDFALEASRKAFEI